MTTIEQIEEAIERINATLGSDPIHYNPVSKLWNIGTMFLRVTALEWVVVSVSGVHGSTRLQLVAEDGPTMLKKVTNFLGKIEAAMAGVQSKAKREAIAKNILLGAHTYG
jgi:hypothetical protein